MYENYAKIRDAMGLSDFEVAKRAGISRAALSRWKLGHSSPSNRTRFKLCQVLGIPPTMRFTGMNDKQEFVIENEFAESDLMRTKRLATYALTLTNGSVVNLTDDQYQELKKGVDAFIDAWVYTHIKE